MFNYNIFIMQDIKKQLIKDLIIRNKIVTLDEIKTYIQNNVTMTIMRKLNELSYLSSYSHRGKYYTLGTIPKFSNQGLWSYQSVHFSKYGTLKNTCCQLINTSQAGYSVKELDQILQVSVRLPALNLFKEGKLFRAPFGGEDVYFSNDKQMMKQQSIIRESQYTNKVFTVGKFSAQVITDELKAAIILFYSTLNEKQRRLYAGLEAIKIGYGGDKLIAQLFNINQETVSKGRQELVSGDFEKQGVRKPGSGRPEIKKNARHNSEN